MIFSDTSSIVLTKRINLPKDRQSIIATIKSQYPSRLYFLYG